MLIVPFQINDKTYAVDARVVKRVLPYCEPTELLEGRLPVLGLTRYNGRMMPVIDLVQRLVGRPHLARLSTRSFLVEIPYRGQWHPTLLLAEGVTGTRKLDPKRDNPTDPVLASDQTYLGEVLAHDGWLIQMIEVEQLLDEPDYDDLFPTRQDVVVPDE
ncbi:chemotaxis protein CheW [Acanthopleuribacter pedis]|uniref:Chemotaxis protein CheW n=1 Tax=Acanthopleuribacter pedis TaxID=442870 RepID=A0A8J7U949_9BACT|nr:chemotaxis protein CheW [Acanthopleuribacter pedis]MBO1323286.1 chemotaxis protein CheW [Acanthopleuribacter pedis]